MNNPKQFDPTKPVQTRDGRKARIICTDIANPAMPILAAVIEPSGCEFSYGYPLDGRSCKSTDSDLVNIPVRREGWVNVYRTLGGKIRVSRAVRETAELARVKANPGHIATVRLEWEEQ